MKLHLITVGEPKLPYAKQGWDEYFSRLGHYHSLQVTRVPDKKAYDADYLLRTAKPQSYKIALAIEGRQFDSEELAAFLDERNLEGRETALIIGGPEGLPQPVIDQADLAWSLSKLTLPHDLAMVVTLEALYRASTINAGHPYHK